MPASRSILLRVAACALALVSALSACTRAPKDDRTREPIPAPGGTFRIASAGDVDSMDPGRIYSTFSYMLFRVMIRNLVAYAPLQGEAGTKLVPDLAEALPAVSADGLTYTFTLRKGVAFQPDVAGGRAIRSSDIRYAIERGFYPSVDNPYVSLYFRDVFVGDEEFLAEPAPGKHITGIDVSNPSAIVFRLKRPQGDFLARLAMPVASPVAEEHAAPFDAKRVSDYGRNFGATGPYQLERRAGTVIGYDPGRSIALVRNTNWDPATDPIRKAYPDRIEVTEGFDNLGQATEKILAGEMDYSGDFQVPAERLRTILANPADRKLVQFHSTNCLTMVTLNTTIPPLDNVTVRKAVSYVLDKRALRHARGGELAGSIASHVLIPGVPAFGEVGGKEFDLYNTPDFAGDEAKARELMRLAGYKDGAYNGKATLIMGTVNTETGRKHGELVAASLAKIGIRVRQHPLQPHALHAQLGLRRTPIAIGASVGWCADYPDAHTVVAPLFDGRRLRDKGNTNYAQLNDAALNELIDRAEQDGGPKRVELWAEAAKRVMDLAPVVPWLWPTSGSLVSRRVVGRSFSVWSSSIDLAVVALEPAQPTG